MNKSLEAFLRGYVVFVVAGHSKEWRYTYRLCFFLYNNANDCVKLRPRDATLVLTGFNVWWFLVDLVLTSWRMPVSTCGWRTFYAHKGAWR